MPDAAICFVVGFLTANVAVGVATGTGADVNSMGVTAAGLVGLWVGLVASMYVVWRSKGAEATPAAEFGLRFERGRDLVGIPIGAAFQLIAVPLIYLPLGRLISDLNDRLEAPARELADQATRGAGIWILGVLVVIGAPVVEELFYRGMLFKSIQRRFGDGAAVGGSAVLFAAAHFEVLQLPALFALGILLGVMAVRYGRIGPGVFVHAGFNAVTMAILVARR